jgi:predicted nucleotidyltransferase
MGSSPYDGMDRLLAAAESGALAELSREHDVTLLVAFGSVLNPCSSARDLDLAVRFQTETPDVLGLLDQLASLGTGDEVDLMVLNHAGPVARERALVGARVLFESRSGEFATTQMAAMMERMDTDWLRALDLELMAR